MKNFNLEELERKQIYSVQDSIFEEVQSRVLAKTTRLEQESPKELKPRGRVIPLKINWSYAAAALVVLVGLGVVLRMNLTEQSPSTENFVTTKTSVVPSTSQVDATSSQAFNSTTMEFSDQSRRIAMETENKKSVNLGSQPEVRKQNSKIAPRTIRSAAIDQVGMDQIITSLSSADIAELSRDAEMDIYLDLY